MTNLKKHTARVSETTFTKNGAEPVKQKQEPRAPQHCSLCAPAHLTTRRWMNQAQVTTRLAIHNLMHSQTDDD